jgi:hypothetical protein
VPIQTRCPSCAAAIPSAAAWCSLCHADLRPRPTPPPAALTVLPDPSHTRDSARPPVARAAAPASDHADGTVTTIVEDAAPVGRHSRARATSPPPAPAALSGRGRHASGGRRAAAPRGTTIVAPVVPVDVEPGQELSPNELDALADRMLAVLAVEDQPVRVLDPEDVPGGKWAFIGGATAAVLAVLLLLSFVVNALTNR